MKHILNNLSDDEKNSIREQHTGGMKVMNENFSKLINSKLGDSKPLVFEQVEEMDEQAVAMTPNVKRLIDDVKNKRLTTSDLSTALQILKQPAQPVQKTTSQPAQKAATQTTPTSARKPGDRDDYYYRTSSSAVR